MRRGEAVAPPPRRVTIHRLEVERVRRRRRSARPSTVDVLEGHVRPPARRRPRRGDRRRRVLPRAAAHAGGPLRRGRRRVARRSRAPTRSAAGTAPPPTRSRTCPARALDDAEQRRRRPRPGAAAPRRGRRHPPARRRRAAGRGRAARRAAAAGGGAVIVRQSLADVPPGERVGRARQLRRRPPRPSGGDRRGRRDGRRARPEVGRDHVPPAADRGPAARGAARAALGAQPPGGAGRGARAPTSS